MECRIEPKVGVIIVAGGKGSRMGGGNTPKQFRILGQAPILVHSINRFAEAANPAQIVVVLPKEHIEFWNNLASRFEVASHTVVEGGAERFDSVKAGIEAMGETIDIIAVHDGVRPLCSNELVKRCIETASKYGSAIPVVAITDSVRVVDGEQSKMVDRGSLRAVQTPQVFDSALLRRAYRCPYQAGLTDDGSVVELSGVKVELCEGEKSNIKITTSEDLIYAQMIVESNDGAENL